MNSATENIIVSPSDYSTFIYPSFSHSEAEPAHKKQLPEHDVKQSSDNSSKRKSEEVNDAESNKKKGNFSMTMKTDAKPALKMTPFSMNLGGVPKKSATVGPLKMSLPSQVSLCKIFCCTKNYIFLKSDIII